MLFYEGTIVKKRNEGALPNYDESLGATLLPYRMLHISATEAEKGRGLVPSAVVLAADNDGQERLTKMLEREKDKAVRKMIVEKAKTLDELVNHVINNELWEKTVGNERTRHR